PLSSVSDRAAILESIMVEDTISAPISNRYDRMEAAGAFGDLGTLIPFIVAYISILKMDPFGVLLAFGLAMIVCGLVYRTPIPVQPMKAAGAICDDAGGANNRHHSGHGVGSESRHGHRVAASRRNGHGSLCHQAYRASGCTWHHSRPRFRLHDRGCKDD